MEGNIFDCLPDSVLLKVIEYLDFGDRQALLQVGPRFRRICYDMELVRCSNFEGCYTLAEDDLRQYVQYSWRYIRVLNLNHCYWLNQKCLHVAIKKCRNLQQLHIIQCNLSTTVLVSLLADLSELRSLSFSTNSFLNIKKETFHPARETLKNLNSVCIYYSSRELAVMNYLGEQSTLLDFCENLEELVINSAEISIPELCRPVFSKPKKLETIKSMSLSSNIHAAANLLFYSTLAVLAHLQIPLEKLLMPNVNFAEFSQKPEYKDCLKNVSELRYLDISGSFQPVDGTILNITAARQLRYYNVSRTKITSQHLADVASSCRNLTSLNIFECSHAFFEGPILNVVGLSELLKRCCQLRHLNIGGIHCHVEDSKSSNQIRKVICEIKGLYSLALPVCLLCDFSKFTSTVASPMPIKYDWNKRFLNGGCPPAKRSRQDQLEPNHQPDSPDAVASQLTESKFFLDEISVNNPGLSCLEIVSVGFLSAFHKNKFVKPKEQQFTSCTETRMVRDGALLAISRLRYLTDLTIIGAPGLNGGSLVEIARCCERLERLSLGFIGDALTGVNTFSKVLVHLKNIKDIRLEQPYMSLDSAFFSSLFNCRRLQRLCIIAKHSHFDLNDLMRAVEQLPYLVVVELFSGETLTGCHKLSTAIKKKFSKSRPGLSVCIFPLLHDDIKDVPKYIPAKHFNELTRFSSNIASLPSNMS